jgi:synaptonemal complex protein 1
LNHQADKAIAEIEGRCDQKLAECQEETRQRLMHVQEEHTKLVHINIFFRIIIIHLEYFLFHLQVTHMQQEHDKRQLCLQAEHSEQLKRTQLQAENELREVE